MTSSERVTDPTASDYFPPRLQHGDRLTRAEFHRRYSAMPEIKKAELIEGEVYLEARVPALSHGKPHADMIGWLGHYEAYTPQLVCADNSTVILDSGNEFQPDGLVLIEAVAGGQARIGEDGYIHGPPELVVEIASSSVSIELNIKLNVYRRHGVKELVVWRVQDGAIDWLVLRDGIYVPLADDSEGVVRSVALPGLILDVPAMLAGDMQKVFTLQLSEISTPAHQAFVEKMSASIG